MKTINNRVLRSELVSWKTFEFIQPEKFKSLKLRRIPMGENKGFALRTVSEYDFGEVTSSFQKSIRRGLEEDALYWGVELDMSGYGEYLWKRMRIIASEDIGLGEPNLPANLFALYQMWKTQFDKKDKKHKPESLFVIHAILLLVRAKKSRVVDHATCVFYRNHEKREVPDYAIDKHTLRGKRMGRGFDHFFDEGIKLENKADIPDPYLERAKETMLGKKGRMDEETLFGNED